MKGKDSKKKSAKKTKKQSSKKAKASKQKEVKPVKIAGSKVVCSPAAACKGSGIYGLGFIGSAVYYISTATGFWNGAWGLIKALLWPAFLVYELLKFLGM